MKMKDVADLAGVSVATVSNVLTGKKAVSDDLTKKVLGVIKDVDYKVDLVARGLKSKQSFSIGVITPEITTLFFPDVLNGIDDAAKKYGYAITYYSSRYDFETEKKYVDQLRSGWADGLLIDSCCPIDMQEEWSYELNKMNNSKMRMPVVCIDRELSPGVLTSVSVDNKGLAFDATKKLIEKGRRNIIHIAAPLNLSLGLHRHQGYLKALQEAGIANDERYIIEGDYSSSTAYLLMKKALKSNLIIDGLFAANDQSAIGALKALLEEGIRVPEQVMIIGFDNCFAGTLVSPSISTYNVPKYKMGYSAFDALYKKMNDPDLAVEKIVLEASILKDSLLILRRKVDGIYQDGKSLKIITL